MSPSPLDSVRNFMGEIPEAYWLVLLSRNRDSELLTNCNWDVALKELGGESDTVTIICHNHWACGWIEYLCIDERNADKKALGEAIEARMDNYPILDESEYSQRQWDAAVEYWRTLPYWVRRRDYGANSRQARMSYSRLCHEESASRVTDKVMSDVEQ